MNLVVGRSSRAETGERSKSEGEKVNFALEDDAGGDGKCDGRAVPSSWSESESTTGRCSGCISTLPSKDISWKRAGCK